MSLSQSHIIKYKHNKEFISFGISNHDNEHFYDWIITVEFYALIHLIEGVIQSIEPSSVINNHNQRLSYMYKYPKVFDFHKVINKYNALSDMSRTARYKTDTTGLDQCKEADILLEDIEQELRSYIQ